MAILTNFCHIFKTREDNHWLDIYKIGNPWNVLMSELKVGQPILNFCQRSSFVDYLMLAFGEGHFG